MGAADQKRGVLRRNPGLYMSGGLQWVFLQFIEQLVSSLDGQPFVDAENQDGVAPVLWIQDTFSGNGQCPLGFA